MSGARRGALLIAGTVTWDRFPDRAGGEPVPGGAVSYAARTAAALGVRARILVLAGPDADLDAFEGHEVHVVTAKATLTHEHRFIEGRRRQRAIAVPGHTMRAKDLPRRWDGFETVVLGPLTPNDLDVPAFAALASGESALLAQGLQRRIAADGEVREAAEPTDLLLWAVNGRMSVFLSHEETAGWPAGALGALAARTRRVVVTDGALGATVIEGGATTEVRAVEADPIDTTGAGDVFATALILALGRGDDLEGAGRVAATLAAAAVGRHGAAPLLSLEELAGDAAGRGRAMEGGAA
ncbi:MAG: hypothetical protein GEU80_13560 [Dehalococcoidia bacterium]|nr:hypothetical protein [Dehalococcoidia bacterium]